jgi:zona occludens toxin
MIVFYLGLPGSGKTYSAVNTIYNNFTDNEDAKKDLKKDYNNCYTNINEFKFDLCHNVYKLDYDELYDKLKVLYDLYHGNVSSSTESSSIQQEVIVSDPIDKRKLSLSEIKALAELKNKELLNRKNSRKKIKASDKELIEKAKELNIYKTLFVIDECHNFFDTEDKIKIWWLTYHRHLYHDITLITQSLSLVSLKYKPLAEAFYKAKAMSLTLNKKYFNYMYYTEPRLTSASFVNTVKVKKRDSVFKLYKSGDSVKSKNVILRFIFISFGFLILLFIFGYYYFYSTEKKIHKENHVQHIENKSYPRVVTHISKNSIDNTYEDDFSDKYFMKFSCSSVTCINSDLTISLPSALFSIFLKKNYIHKYYFESIHNNFFIYYVSMSNDFYQFLNSNGSGKNENSISNMSVFTDSKR